MPNARGACPQAASRSPPPLLRLPLLGTVAYNGRNRQPSRLPFTVTAGADTQKMPNTVYVLNGPNLNLLGMREPSLYGHATLADVEKLCRATAQRFGLGVEFRQSNHEGQIIDWIQQARAEKAVGLLINPAGFTTTSISILDALYTLEVPVIEIHITNIHARESFRHDSYVSKVARAVICGFGAEGYALAISGLAALIGAKAGA